MKSQPLLQAHVESRTWNKTTSKPICNSWINHLFLNDNNRLEYLATSSVAIHVWFLNLSNIRFWTKKGVILQIVEAKF